MFNEIKELAPRYSSVNFTFIQIGANDGQFRDPISAFIKEYNWTGVLVEPIRGYFLQLEKNYDGCPNVVFENVAIADYNGQFKMYRVKDNVPFIARWYKGISSYNRAHLLKHRKSFKSINKNIVEEKVQCLTLTELARKHKIKRLNLLILDVEGYEYHIIKQVPRLSFRPEIIYYEHRHLDHESKAKCHNLLCSLGYHISYRYENAIAHIGKKKIFSLTR